MKYDRSPKLFSIASREFPVWTLAAFFNKPFGGVISNRLAIVKKLQLNRLFEKLIDLYPLMTLNYRSLCSPHRIICSFDVWSTPARYLPSLCPAQGIMNILIALLFSTEQELLYPYCISSSLHFLRIASSWLTKLKAMLLYG